MRSFGLRLHNLFFYYFPNYVGPPGQTLFTPDPELQALFLPLDGSRFQATCMNRAFFQVK